MVWIHWIWFLLRVIARYWIGDTPLLDPTFISSYILTGLQWVNSLRPNDIFNQENVVWKMAAICLGLNELTKWWASFSLSESVSRLEQRLFYSIKPQTTIDNTSDQGREFQRLQKYSMIYMGGRHLSVSEMALILQATFSNWFSRMKIFLFWFTFHRCSSSGHN